MAALNSGSVAVVPGKVDASALYERITSEDADERMPPAGSGKRLTPSQIKTLRLWIEQGASWEEHWSLVAPRRPAVAEVENTAWPRNEIDRFVLARLEGVGGGITPAPEADRITLIRRLSLDLLGLPPTPEEVDAFCADTRPDAYERLVERLLASPHYGERMAVAWLDLVRFADTVGYHSDVERSIALYRDYVINAFNENLPFDRFTLEQLAGDLLRNPTDWQRIASAYNMLGMSTEEGGAQPKEYLAKYAADRVRNFGSVWMGATLGCAECHDHKYDPYTARDFYALEAFFADIRQPGVGTPRPTVAMPTPEQSAALRRLDARIASLADGPSSKEREALKAAHARIDRAIRKTIVTEHGPPRVTRVLHRGDWMDETGAVVEPAVPEGMRRFNSPPGQRATRLDLARWLVAPDHPQTARVVVNRLWKRFFGTGLSDSLDDLGLQGERPTHPELLDWLAVEFRESGWDLRHMVRLMVTSSTYRQSSQPRSELATLDPNNRLHARQDAFRLEAEQIRDAALAAGGLLDRRVGGESVRPYQPEGYWRFLNFPKRDYTPSQGPDQYRRGLYIHWQRTLLHPSLLAFDAPSREMCTAKRPISNTPQAALTLLNDPSFVEAARALADRALEEEPTDDRRLTRLWRLVLSRPPLPSEAAILAALLEKHRSRYRDEVAAWTSVARAVLNLDETITRD